MNPASKLSSSPVFRSRLVQEIKKSREDERKKRLEKRVKTQKMEIVRNRGLGFRQVETASTRRRVRAQQKVKWVRVGMWVRALI